MYLHTADTCTYVLIIGRDNVPLPVLRDAVVICRERKREREAGREAEWERWSAGNRRTRSAAQEGRGRGH